MTSKAKTAASNVLKFPAIGGDEGWNGVRAMPAARAALPPSGSSPVARSQAQPAAAIASKFAEQHQVDPDEAYRDAIYAEIKAKLRAFIGYAVMVGVAVAIGIMLAVGHS